MSTDDLCALRERIKELAKKHLIYLLEERSEHDWCAGWMDGHENAMWKDIHEPSTTSALPQRYGPDWKAEVRQLAEEAGAWPTFNNEGPEDYRWVPLDEWRSMHTDFSP